MSPRKRLIDHRHNTMDLYQFLDWWRHQQRFHGHDKAGPGQQGYRRRFVRNRRRRS